MTKLARGILWLEPLVLALIALAFWYPTPTRTDWLWLLWLLVPILIARYICYRRFITRTPLDIIFIILMVLGVMNVAVAPYTRGLMMLARPLLGMALYYALVERARTDDSLRGPLQVMVLLALVVGLAALGATQWNAKAALLRPLIAALPTISGSVIGGGFNPNEIAGAIAWLLPLMAGVAIYRWRTNGVRWDVTLAFIMLLAALLFGQSRSAVVGVIVALALIASLLLRNLWRILGWLLVIAIIALEMVLFTDDVLPALTPTDSDSPAAQESINEQVNTRAEIWNSALAIAHDYPLSGVGLSMFRDNRVRAQYPVPTLEGRILPHAHNEYLQLLADMGIPGLIVFLGLYGGAFWMLWRVWRLGDAESQALSVAIGVGLLAHGIFGFADAITLWDRFTFVFWLMIGMAGAVYTHVMQPQR